MTAKQTGKATRKPAKKIGKSKQKPAKTAARKSEELYRTLVESALDGIVIHVGDRVAFANRAAAAMLGFAGPAALVGQPLASFVHPADLASAADRVRRVLAGEAVAYPVEVRYLRQNGTELPVENTGALVSYKGKPAILSVIRDITEHKRTEDALRLSEEKFGKAFHGSPDAVLITRASDGRVVEVNEGFTKLTGFERDEALRSSALALGLWVDPGDRERFVAALQRDGSVSGVEFGFRVKSGDILQCLLSGAIIDVHGEPHILSVVRDVTEQRRAEAAVRRSEELLRGILDNLQDAYVRTDAHGRFVMVSPSAARMYGYGSTDAMIGLPTEVLYADAVARRAMIKQLQRDGRVADYVGQGRKKDGSTFSVSLNAQVFRDEQGNVAGMEGFVRDITERGRAEELLAKSEARLRAVLDAAPFPVAIVDLKDDIIDFWSRSAHTLFGHTAPTAAEWYEMAYPDKKYRQGVVDRWKPFLEKAQASGQTVNTGEYRITCHDGSVRICELHVAFIADSLVVTFDDVTESKRAEAALRESEQRLALAIDGTGAGLWDWDMVSNQVVYSAQWKKMLGYEANEVEDSFSGWKDLWHPDDRANIEKALQDYLDGTTDHYEIVHRLRHKDGGWRWILCRGEIVKDARGKPCRWVGTNLDITERKRAEEALRESEARYRRITEGLTDYQYTVRVADGRAVETRQSPACERVTGYTPQEYAADPYLWIQMVTTEDRDRVREHARRILAGEDVPAIEHRLARKDGAVRWVRDTAILLRDDSGRLLSYDGVISDITDRKQAEEEIRRKAKDLQEKNEELTSFTYAVSHDLRSPLVTIQTFQGYLEQDVLSQDAARIEKDLGYIRNAADKMGLLLDELLRLSRVGRVTNPPEEAPLQSLVKEALDLVAGRLTARGVKVEVTEEPVMLTGDRTRLVEVFQNLVDNATKFMGDEPAPRVEIGVEQAGEELVLFVRDNGIGIEPQFQPLVFGVFRKLDPGTEGVGLGLALVRRIVELHGGRVWVESEGLGKGTTFRFTLAQTTRKRD